jgi:translocation and assembly module TamB
MTLDAASPLSLLIKANVDRLENLASLAGARVAAAGRVNADLAVKGTLGKPDWSGTVAADDLALTFYDQGVRLHDGVARLNITNNAVQLREVVFHGGGGTLRATGSIPLDRSQPALTATIVAERLQLIADPSRQLTLSGKALAVNPNGQLHITGGFTVDHALFSLPDKSAPRLGDDVVVLGPGSKKDKGAARAPQTETGLLPPQVAIKLALGSDFRFRGSGAALLLGGGLDITSGPNQPARAAGNVRVVNGVYEAFGAKLNIERGLIAFQGPFDNPSLNIVAMRREQEVKAGVQVTGTLRDPRVDLVSEPNLPDEEKLSWLVFGRSSAAGGNGSSAAAGVALQAAASGLFNKMGSGKLAAGLGLDKLALGSSQTGALAGQQVVTLGKEISNRLYVGYEQSLAGIGGVVKLTYELTQHWSVALLGGASTGLDVLYSRRFDTWGGRRQPRDRVSATD